MSDDSQFIRKFRDTFESEFQLSIVDYVNRDDISGDISKEQEILVGLFLSFEDNKNRDKIRNFLNDADCSRYLEGINYSIPEQISEVFYEPNLNEFDEYVIEIAKNDLGSPPNIYTGKGSSESKSSVTIGLVFIYEKNIGIYPRYQKIKNIFDFREIEIAATVVVPSMEKSRYNDKCVLGYNSDGDRVKVIVKFQ